MTSSLKSAMRERRGRVRLSLAQSNALELLHAKGGREYLHSFHIACRVAGIRMSTLDSLVRLGAITKEYVPDHGTDYVLVVKMPDASQPPRALPVPDTEERDT